MTWPEGSTHVAKRDGDCAACYVLHFLIEDLVKMRISTTLPKAVKEIFEARDVFMVKTHKHPSLLQGSFPRTPEYKRHRAKDLPLSRTLTPHYKSEYPTNLLFFTLLGSSQA